MRKNTTKMHFYSPVNEIERHGKRTRLLLDAD